MYQNSIVAAFGYLLFFLSYGLYILGLSKPIFGLKGEFVGADVFFANFIYSFYDAIKKLEESKMPLPLILVILFTYVVPIAKLLLGILCLVQPLFLKYVNKKRYQRYGKGVQENFAFEKLHSFTTKADGFFEKIAYTFSYKVEPVAIIRIASKYQFTDSFMAMIMLAMLSKTFVALEILEGGFYFWGYCMLSLLATQIISLTQLPVGKNMLFEGVKFEYEILQKKTSPSDDSNIVTIVEDDGSKTKGSNPMRSQVIISLALFALVVSISVFCYIFFFFTTSLLVEVNVLDYRFTLFTSALKGWQLLENVNNSQYIVNGYFTILFFVFVLPAFHLVGIIYVYIYFSYSFLTDPNYKNSLEIGLTQTKSETDDSGDYTTFNFYNLLKSRASTTINEYDFMLLKYKNRKPWISTLIQILDHVGDWCMMEIYCIAMITAYYTLNAVPNIEGNLPHKEDTTHFFFMISLMIAAAFLNLGFNRFANRIHNLEQESFKSYNQKYKCLPKLIENGNSTQESNYTQKFPLKTKTSLPKYFSWSFMIVSVVTFIVSAVFTSTSYTPYPELTVDIADEIFGHQVPFFNQVLGQLPYSMGNCDREVHNIIPINKSHYKPAWSVVETSDFLREFKFDTTSADDFEENCYPIALFDPFKGSNNAKYDPQCLVKADPTMNCGVIPPGLVRFYIPALKEVIIVNRISGISTAWIQDIDISMNTVDAKEQLQIDVVVRIPDFDVDIFFGIPKDDSCITDDGICTDIVTQRDSSLSGVVLGPPGLPATLKLHFTFDCHDVETDEEEKGPFSNMQIKDIVIIKDERYPIYVFDAVRFIRLDISGLTELINQEFEIPTIGKFSISDLVNIALRANSQAPYTCKVINQGEKAL